MSAKNFMSPYVQAFSALSVEDVSFAAGVADMEAFCAAMHADTLLRDFLCSPAIDKAVRETLVRKALKELGVQELVSKVLVLMIRKNAIAHLDQFVALLRVHADERLNIMRGSVNTAVELSEDAREKIKELLVGLTGKKVEVRFGVESKLIGGLRVKMRDLDMDATVLRQLENAKTALKNKRA
jgi:F-type H+-transporting ATPase subunit delta